jgi:GT2 family glycosyltransferase
MAAGRPAVDVVIPFAGSVAGLRELLGRLEAIELDPGAGDAIFVADNRPSGEAALTTGAAGAVTLLRVPEVRSSYHARNRAAAAGSAPWILFVDADVQWRGSMLRAYFEPPPGERTAVLGGGIEDEQLATERRPTLAERYAVANATMASANTLEHPDRAPYAQTANCLVRRAAFEGAGGFVDGIRSAGDADLCWRLQETGWLLEQRPTAAVVHSNRRSLAALLGQKARHGAGAAWLERRHHGSFPRRRLPGLAWWSAGQVATALRPGALATRTPPPADRIVPIVDVAAVWAFELGRLRSNEARRSGGR